MSSCERPGGCFPTRRTVAWRVGRNARIRALSTNTGSSGLEPERSSRITSASVDDKAASRRGSRMQSAQPQVGGGDIVALPRTQRRTGPFCRVRIGLSTLSISNKTTTGRGGLTEVVAPLIADDPRRSRILRNYADPCSDLFLMAGMQDK